LLTYDLHLHQHRTLQIRPDFQYLKRRPFSKIDSQYTRGNASHAFEFRDTWRLISPTAERESATSPQFEIAANKMKLRYHYLFTFILLLLDLMTRYETRNLIMFRGFPPAPPAKQFVSFFPSISEHHVAGSDNSEFYSLLPIKKTNIVIKIL
jgi:hypothetical protein